MNEIIRLQCIKLIRCLKDFTAWYGSASDTFMEVKLTEP